MPLAQAIATCRVQLATRVAENVPLPPTVPTSSSRTVANGRPTHGRQRPTRSAAARGHRPQRPTHGRHSVHPLTAYSRGHGMASRREPAAQRCPLADPLSRNDSHGQVRPEIRPMTQDAPSNVQRFSFFTSHREAFEKRFAPPIIWEYIHVVDAHCAAGGRTWPAPAPWQGKARRPRKRARGTPSLAGLRP